MSMGTSGTLYGYSEKPIMDPEGILAAFCSSIRRLAAAAVHHELHGGD
jgi:sugar (pentulose or hexulose) kinase